MVNNDIIRSIRYMLQLNDEKIVAIIKNTGHITPTSLISNGMKKEEEDGYQLIDDSTTLRFLDGLIIHFRGKDESRPPMPLELPANNNVILKKLKIAFTLKDEDILSLLEKASFKISKPELSALFRKSDHQNYRPCGDQLLRYLLKGLTQKLRT